MDDSTKDAAHFVSKALQGDSEAFATLYEKCVGPVYSAAYRILKHKQDAEDAVQEAFTRAYMSLRELKDASKFCAWTKRIAVNWSLNMIRKRRARNEESLDSSETGVTVLDDSSDETESRDIILEALAHLRPKQREVIALRWMDGLSTHEIADALRISDPAVRRRMNRGMSNLREWLEYDHKEWLKASYPQWFDEM